MLTARLEELRKYITDEFPRKLRGAQNATHFKATEFRFFLLYSGPIALKNILSTTLYIHFLLLHVATRLLCCSLKATVYTQYAKDLYRHFFSLLPQLYGNDSQINNMHNIIHIADDVQNMQCCLDDERFPI